MTKNDMIVCLEERLVYKNKYVNVFDDKVRFPSGQDGTYFRTRWTAPYGVAALPYRNGELFLLENFRYNEGAFSIEAPQGFGAHDNKPQDDVVRELSEELNVYPSRLVHLGHTGYDYRTHLFLAELPEKDVISTKNKEPTEAIKQVLSFNIGKSPSLLIDKLDIHDAVTQILLLKMEALIRNKCL